MNKSTILSYRSLIIYLPFIWLVIFVLLPFLLVFLISFKDMSYEISPVEHFFNIKTIFSGLSFKNYSFILTEVIYRETFIESIKLAFITMFFTLIISYPFAYGIYQCQEKIKNILIIAVIVPFWTSMLIRVYAWMVLLKNNGVINNLLIDLGLISQPIQMMNSNFAVVLALVYSYMPFMVLPIISSLEKINPRLLEAAEDLGASPISSFINITLPLSLKGIITGCVLVFVPSMGELVIPELLGGANVLTLSKIMWFEFFSNRDWPLTSSITILMLLIVVAPIILIQKTFIQENKE
jgi:putrescine transport system permease protein